MKEKKKMLTLTPDEPLKTEKTRKTNNDRC